MGEKRAMCSALGSAGPWAMKGGNLGIVASSFCGDSAEGWSGKGGPCRGKGGRDERRKKGNRWRFIFT